MKIFFHWKLIFRVLYTGLVVDSKKALFYRATFCFYIIITDIKWERLPLYTQNTVNNKHNPPLYTKTNHKNIIHSPLASDSIYNN